MTEKPRAWLAPAVALPLALALSACAPLTGADDVKAGMTELRANLESIAGVEAVDVAGSSDGSPSRRRVNVTLYLNDLSPQVVTPVVEAALEDTWAFDAFTPVGYSIQVWPAPIPTPPRDADTMFDLTLIQDELGVGGYVYNRQLFLSAEDLEATFGETPGQ